MLPIIRAWLVHAYTALGLICAAVMAVLIVAGGDAAFRLAFAVMIVATVIDATDGWLARRARVSDVLPAFDGRRLDDLIDFQTYTCLPLLLVWRAGLLDPFSGAWLLVPLVASAYGFCQVGAKTDDHYFIGFPSYWNIVAFYIYVMRWPSTVALALVLVLAVLTFVPTRYLYTSYAGRWSSLTNALAAGWLALLVWVLVSWNATASTVALVSLAFPIYYMLLSWGISLASLRAGR
jgi:phosphatidylcholine synthase